MATTYTVTTSFTADTTAVASEVNQNFTDVLTALNAYDASNLSSGTVPVARISGLTVTQLAATTIVLEAEGIDSSDNDTSWPTTAAVKDYVDTQDAAGVAGQYHTDSTVLFNDSGLSAADTFQDLDIATLASISAVDMLCFFQITYNFVSGGGGTFAMKPKGQGSATYNLHNVGGSGTASFNPNTDGDIAYFICATDSNGKVQIASNGVAAAHKWTIKLLGYIK